MWPHGGACSKVATDPCKIGVVAFNSHRLHAEYADRMPEGYELRTHTMDV